MIFSMLFLIVTFKDQNLLENRTNLMDTPKIVDLCRVHGAHFFQLLGTPDTWWNQGNNKCQGEWWSRLSRESRGPRPWWTLLETTGNRRSWLVQEHLLTDQSICGRKLASIYIFYKIFSASILCYKMVLTYDSLCPKLASKWASSYLCHELYMSSSAITGQLVRNCL